MKKEYILAVITVLLWGTSPPVCKVLLTGASNMQVLFCSTLPASLFLFAMIFVKGEKAALFALRGKDVLRLCGLGFLGFFLYSSLYYAAIACMDAQVACIINYLWPIFTVCFACLILKEKFTFGTFAALLLSFAGVAVVTLQPGEGAGFSLRDLKGCFFCILAAAFYGLFCNLNKKQGGSQTVNMFFYQGLSCVLSFFCALYLGFTPIGHPDVLGFLWIGVMVDAVGYLFWALALQGSNASAISNLAFGTPAIAVLLCHFFLGEPLYVSSFVGLGLILAGIFLQMVVQRKGNTDDG